jgi:hypothetical protein
MWRLYVFGLAVTDVSKKLITFIFTKYVEPTTVGKESCTFIYNNVNVTYNVALPQSLISGTFYIRLQEKEKSSFTTSNSSKLSDMKTATHIVISTLKFLEYRSIFRLLWDIICREAFACLSR